MKSPCGFLEGSRSPGTPGVGSTSRPDAAREAHEYKPKRPRGPGRRSGAAASRATAPGADVAGWFETVILDDCGYETLPTCPIPRKGRDYTATDRPAGVIPRRSAGPRAMRPTPGRRRENACDE